MLINTDPSHTVALLGRARYQTLKTEKPLKRMVIAFFMLFLLKLSLNSDHVLKLIIL